MHFTYRSLIALSATALVWGLFISTSSADEAPPDVPAGVSIPSSVFDADEIGTAASAASCAGYVSGNSTGDWGNPSQGTCGIAGHPGFRLGYSWSNTTQVGVCVQGRGYNGSTSYFEFAGCGHSGTFGGTVPWGNVLSTPMTRLQNPPPYAITASWWV